MNRRRDVLKKYEEFAQGYDESSIDELCKKSDSGFQLQVQQSFLRKFIHENPDLKHVLLYHQIGSGKTITSIILAEEYMTDKPSMKTLVILPARLKSNFFNELMLLPKYMSCLLYTSPSPRD